MTLALALAVAALVCAPSPRPSPRLVPLSSMKSDVEVILGDPEVAGEPFVMRIRELPGTIIPLHTHPVDEHITVLEGIFFLRWPIRSTWA